jgi:hypothetical protein
MVGLPQGDSPVILNSSYTITADIEVPAGGAEGMMLTSGGRFGGYGFYLLKGKPVFLWNLVDLERLKWEGTEALTPGRHTSSSTSSTTAWAPAPLPSTTSAASAVRAPAR